ncbi:MAG: hypothetical protein IBX72_13360 [Nitrospirae bacterium]|nr:hypothetical protein [Nitrospirota bacterium]
MQQLRERRLTDTPWDVAQVPCNCGLSLNSPERVRDSVAGLMKTVALILAIILFASISSVYAESVYIVQPNLKEVKYKSIVAPETVIPKPTCPPDWVPSIFITPAVISAYGDVTDNQLNVLSVFKIWAVDNGNETWTVKVQVKDNKGNLFTGSDEYQRVLVETMCCPAGGDCQ